MTQENIDRTKELGYTKTPDGEFWWDTSWSRARSWSDPELVTDPPKLYKVLTIPFFAPKEGEPVKANVPPWGAGQWPLPTKNPDGTWTPGRWWTETGALEQCRKGLHSFSSEQADKWIQPRMALYEIEYEGPVQKIDAWKWMGGRARLTRAIEVDMEKLYNRLRLMSTENRVNERNHVGRLAFDLASRPFHADIKRRLWIERIQYAKAELGPVLTKRLLAELDSDYSKFKESIEKIAHSAYYAYIAMKTTKADELFPGYATSKRQIAFWKRLQRIQRKLLRNVTRRESGYVRIYDSENALLAFGTPAYPKWYEEASKARNVAAKKAESDAMQQWDLDNPEEPGTTFEDLLAEYATDAPTKRKRGV